MFGSYDKYHLNIECGFEYLHNGGRSPLILGKGLSSSSSFIAIIIIIINITKRLVLIVAVVVVAVVSS